MGCPRGQTPASPRFPTYPQKEVKQQGHRVRKAAGLSLGDMGFSIAQETLEKESEVSEQLENRNGFGARNAESGTTSVFYLFHHSGFPHPTAHSSKVI